MGAGLRSLVVRGVRQEFAYYPHILGEPPPLRDVSQSSGGGATDAWAGVIELPPPGDWKSPDRRESEAEREPPRSHGGEVIAMGAHALLGGPSERDIVDMKRTYFEREMEERWVEVMDRATDAAGGVTLQVATPGTLEDETELWDFDGRRSTYDAEEIAELGETQGLYPWWLPVETGGILTGGVEAAAPHEVSRRTIGQWVGFVDPILIVDDEEDRGADMMVEDPFSCRKLSSHIDMGLGDIDRDDTCLLLEGGGTCLTLDLNCGTKDAVCGLLESGCLPGSDLLLFQDMECLLDFPPDCLELQPDGTYAADENCGKEDPNTLGGVLAADFDCGKFSATTGSERHSDNLCGKPTGYIGTNHGDADCHQVAHGAHSDANCGGTYAGATGAKFDADEACNATNAAGGGTYSDRGCGNVAGGQMDRDSDCGAYSAGIGSLQKADRDCGRAIGGGNSGVVSKDQDCVLRVAGSRPGEAGDQSCGRQRESWGAGWGDHACAKAKDRDDTNKFTNPPRRPVAQESKDEETEIEEAIKSLKKDLDERGLWPR